MSGKTIRIVSEPGRLTGWRAWYGDTELQNMLSISYEQEAGQFPIVSIRFIAPVEIEATTDLVVIPDAPLDDGPQ